MGKSFQNNIPESPLEPFLKHAYCYMYLAETNWKIISK